MAFEKLLFYVFAVALIAASFGVITSKNPVRAVLFLVLTFVATSAIWVLLHAEYLAMILILVYVGAVMVLFLFVVMMLDINIAPMKEGFIKHLPISIAIAIIFVAQIVWVMYNNDGMPLPFDTDKYEIGSIQAIGQAMYTRYIFNFEIAAVILMVAMIGSMMLTFRGARKRKKQNPAHQVAVKRHQRVRVLSMKAEDYGAETNYQTPKDKESENEKTGDEGKS